VAWSVDNVDLYSLVEYGCVLGKNCNSALSLNIIGVHDAVYHLLVGSEHAALAQQLIYQRRLAMVYMGNNRDISDIFTLCLHNNLSLSFLLIFYTT